MDELTKKIIKRFPKGLILFEVIYTDGTGHWVKMTGDERLSISESTPIQSIQCHPNTPAIWNSTQCVFFTDIKDIDMMIKMHAKMTRCDNCMDWFRPPLADIVHCNECRGYGEVEDDEDYDSNDKNVYNENELTPQDDVDPGDPEDDWTESDPFPVGNKTPDKPVELKEMTTFLDKIKETHNCDHDLLEDIKRFVIIGYNH